jgi:2-polyprenyl-6-methoxyphenol hydroxylase-like FAD-dependent oxidoreductase
MRPGNNDVVHEPAREVPVYGHCDVLVVGGGPAGTSAAIAAARMGADVVLIERYGHLGGLSTGGHVCWIDRMTDWDGRLVVGGVGQEFMDRCDAEPGGLIGPPRESWGSKAPDLVDYWAVRSSAHRGVVTWAPTIDPEVLKCASNDMVRESKVHMIFHAWSVATLHDGGRVRGVVVESKEGRLALLARVTIDCTGDGDVFAAAGGGYVSDFDSSSIHARVNTSFRMGGVDTDRYFAFRQHNRAEFNALIREAEAHGVGIRCGVMPRKDQVVVMAPKYSGYSAIKIADLTEVEFRSRDQMRKGLAWFKANVPGFENAYIMDTAPQVGTRHSRRVNGVATVTIDHWKASGRYPDSIGLCPGLSPAFPTLEIPYGCLLPGDLDGILVAGRNLSCDPQSHNPLREVPECWVMGQGAGVAAAIAVRDGVNARDVPISDLQQALRHQGAIVDAPRERVSDGAREEIDAVT